jgi:hypothetical protein
VLKPPRSRITVFEVMVLIAGLAVGLWIILPQFRAPEAMGSPDAWMGVIPFTLGGFALVGLPMLLWERRRTRVRWGAGRFLWCTQGTAAWLLWPPVIYVRAKEGNINRSMGANCYLYGTPLMAVYVLSALVLGGWFRKRRRRAMRMSWREQFGMGMALVWACFGLYLLSIFYRDDFRR